MIMATSYIDSKNRGTNGTTARKLTPMELMERLVALVPRPRVHLTRYHGVLLILPILREWVKASTGRESELSSSFFQKLT